MTNISDAGNGATTDFISTIFGVPQPPPPPQTAQPTLGSAPTVSSTPTAGQGIATDLGGKLPIGIAAQAIPVRTDDPATLVTGMIWYRSDTSQLCIQHDSSTTKRVTLT